MVAPDAEIAALKAIRKGIDQRIRVLSKSLGRQGWIEVDHDYLSRCIGRDRRSTRLIEVDAGIGQGTLAKCLTRRACMRIDIAERVASTLGIEMYDLTGVRR